MFTSDNFEELFCTGSVFVDVRSEGEFASGHAPGAINLPILNNAERAAVGLCYREQGQDAAIALGNRLVSGDVKKSRISAWQNLISKNPQAAIYCARGGMRSEIAQAWLKDCGINVPRVRGGYKTLRRFLGQQIDLLLPPMRCRILGGRTGSGKTFLLERLNKQNQKIIDLEDLARHRGSAFGAVAVNQPSQANFENMLAVQLIKAVRADRTETNSSALWFEDESRMIGRIALPTRLFETITTAPLYVLEASLDQRVNILIDHYILRSDKDTEALKQHYLSCLVRIRRRLGDQQTRVIHKLIGQAFNDYVQTGDQSSHRLWIEPLLTSYYDPLYDRHLTRQQHRIVARGTFEELACLSIS